MTPKEDEPRLVTLAAGERSLVLRVPGDGLAEWLAFGPPIGPAPARAFVRSHPFGMLDEEEPLSLVPEPARGFSGHPGAILAKGGDWRPTKFRLTGVKHEDSRVDLSYLDAATEARLAIAIAIDPLTGVLRMRMSLENQGTEELEVHWLSLAARIPESHADLVTVGGAWGEEWRWQRRPMPPGLSLVESRTGRTSHHAFPGLVFCAPGTDESTGEALALHLGALGNHRCLAERLRDGRTQAQLGELLAPGEVRLAPGEVYAAPEVFAAWSDMGFNGLRAAFQPFVRGEILPATRAPSRPVQFNSWEAVYFSHEPAVLEALVAKAAAVGAERFVLDDGWFKGRDHDRAGLGDWTPCPKKYPHGLAPLIEKVHAQGMGFGLWVEPEMVNPDSDLFRAHPDWILGDPDQPLGRNQLVLDLTRADAFDHIFAALDRLLQDYRIDYLKWDMNRDLTAAVGGGRALAAAQARAVVRLVDALRRAHPRLEIETCASGGARASFALLQRTERIWVSDALDPISRQGMQRAFSLFFPSEVMGAHVGARRNVLTGRSSGMSARAITALFGHMGIEQNLLEADDREVAALRAFIEIYKSSRSWMHKGLLLALDHPDSAVAAMMAVSEDHARALVSVVPTGSLASPVPAPLRVRGFGRDEVYSVRTLSGPVAPAARMKHPSPIALGESLEISGAFLDRHGLELPVLKPDMALLFEIFRRPA